MKTVDEIAVYQDKPNGFVSHVEVAAAYVEAEGKILFLQRAGSERGLWGVPAGKIEEGETPDSAAERELFEETGICLNTDAKMEDLGKLFMRKPGLDYTYHMYRVSLANKPLVTLSSEHLKAEWFKTLDVSDLDLMAGALEAFNYYQQCS